jgi:hypothetical protein
VTAEEEAVRVASPEVVAGTVVDHEERLSRLFAAWANGDIEGFLSGCSERLFLTVWGTASSGTFVPRTELRAWHEGLQGMTLGTLRSEVLLTLSLGIENVVMLSHSFVLHGEHRRYDTVEHCVFSEGQLAAWFSRPSNSQQYAEAWRDPATGAAAPSVGRASLTGATHS